MMSTDSTATPTRTLTIVLPEADWRALRTAEPDAIGWLHAQIRQRLSANGVAPSSAFATSQASTESLWGDDDY